MFRRVRGAAVCLTGRGKEKEAAEAFAVGLKRLSMISQLDLKIFREKPIVRKSGSYT